MWSSSQSATSSITIKDVASGEELFGLGGPVNETAWSLDGGYLATAGAGVVRIYDLAGNAVWTLPEHVAEARLRFGPRGLLATSGRLGSSPEDAIKIWDLRTQALVATIPSPGSAMAFDRSGALLATDGDALEIWDIEQGELVAELPAARADVNDLAFSPDGSRLAVASADGKVRLFDLGSGEEVLVLPVREGICCALAFSPDGSMLATRDSDGTVRVWAMDIDDLLEIARSEVTRSLTDEECRRYLHLARCSTPPP